MINQSADYALRAVLFVAQRTDDGCTSADMIAGATGIPRNYLGKVLHVLSQAQVLTSIRGPNGGFRLAQAPETLSLATVVQPFQKMPARQMCLHGNRECDATDPCSSHQRWQDMADRITTFFQDTTIALLLRDEGVPGNGLPHPPKCNPRSAT
jgi:Rrf2 family transcriptional regulator, iron-sulfur cluster assembly transcription factor